MIDELPLNKLGQVIIDNGRKNGNGIKPSAYSPDDDTKEVTAMARRDLRIGYNIMNRPYRELNDRSIIQAMNDAQMAFNTYIPPRSQDPDESWKAQTVRPITRNKIISIAAHVCASVIYPQIFAENKDNEESKFAGDVMETLIEWVTDNSDYARKFVYAILASLVNPAIIMKAEYLELYRTIRSKTATGEYETKQAVDELMSGFQTSIIPCDEFYITNTYEHDVQKQRAVITRRFIDYADAATIYVKDKNWEYVKPGIKVLFNDREATFYEQRDDNLMGYLVEEVKYYNRALDLWLTFVNGILMGDAKNPNPRIDKLYPFAKSGFEPFDEGRFFYYKSCVDKLAPDQDLVDTLYNMVMDGTFLALMPPLAMYGTESIDSSVIVPGAVTQLRETSKVEPIKINSDLRGGLEAIQLAEKSIAESSQDSTFNGQAQDGTQTAYEIAQQQQNAMVDMQLFFKMIGFLVEDLGKLMVGDIIQHMTVADSASLMGDETRPKYRSFLVHDKTSEGKKVSKKVVFNGDLPTENEPLDSFKKREFDLLKQSGGPEGNKKIYMVNPSLFRELKFKTRVAADTMGPKNRALEKALNLEAYDRMIQNPVLDQEAITRDFLIETYKPGESDKYLKTSQGQQMPDGMPQPQAQQPQPGAAGPGGAVPGVTQKGVNQNLTGQLTGSNNLSNTLLKTG